VTTVLIVDDEKTLRDGLSEAVRDLGYAPVVASSGREALAVAAQTNLDAVLLDLRMPDMDGLQVLTRLRNEPGAQNSPSRSSPRMRPPPTPSKPCALARSIT